MFYFEISSEDLFHSFYPAAFHLSAKNISATKFLKIFCVCVFFFILLGER